MAPIGEPSSDTSNLRKQAEEVVRGKAAASPMAQFGELDFAQTLHELQVHQIELELQNEELRRAQLELDAQRARYFDLYDLAPVGYLTLNEHGLILEANLTAATMLGVARGAMVKQPISRFIHPDDKDLYYMHRKRLLDTQDPQDWDIRMLKGDDTAFWGHLAASVEQDTEGDIEVRIALSDITERKHAEEEKRKLQAQLEHSKKLESLGTMTGGVAHNLNNVLAAIMAAASARQILTKSPEDLAVYKFIDSACKRGRDVVRSLLHFARPNLSQASPVDLNALTAELSKLLEGTNQSRIRIVQNCSSESLWVSGNIGTLSSALLNLCLNAMDALPNAGTLTLRTMIPEKDWVGVTVEDNGEGMSPEILAKALDPFFTTKDVGKGTGLGLSMAYGVITAHGGTMEISSQPGQGTTVTIRLPRIPAPVQAAVMQPEAPDLGSLSILLVDDDENVRILAAMMFKAGGLAADYAEGGEEALEYLRTHDLPDLIILDQNMPVMDGAETMEAIRVLHPDLPILISSGRMDIEDWECFKRPNVAVLSKPFELAELRAKLATMDLQPRRRP